MARPSCARKSYTPNNDERTEPAAMHRITIYACDFCPAVRSDRAAMFAHEAAHYGLTAEKYGQWQDLREEAEAAGRRVGLCKNPETDAAFDGACRALAEFETRNGLEYGKPKCRDVP